MVYLNQFCVKRVYMLEFLFGLQIATEIFQCWNLYNFGEPLKK